VPQALDILRRAALREAIPREQGVALARAVMSSTSLGRLCLAVLDEGQARALVELASAVCREIAGGAAAASTYAHVNSPAPNTDDDG
jgi:hypothetical protein